MKNEVKPEIKPEIKPLVKSEDEIPAPSTPMPKMDDLQDPLPPFDDYEYTKDLPDVS